MLAYYCVLSLFFFLLAPRISFLSSFSTYLLSFFLLSFSLSLFFLENSRYFSPSFLSSFSIFLLISFFLEAKKKTNARLILYALPFFP